MLDVNEFIESCESLKITPYDYSVATELFNKDLNGKRHFTKKGAAKANRRIEYVRGIKEMNDKARPLLEDLWKDVPKSVEAALGKAYKKVKSLKDNPFAELYTKSNWDIKESWDTGFYIRGDGPEVWGRKYAGYGREERNEGGVYINEMPVELPNLRFYLMDNQLNPDVVGWDVRDEDTIFKLEKLIGSNYTMQILDIVIPALEKVVPETCSIYLAQNNDEPDTLVTVALNKLPFDLIKELSE